MRIKRLAAGIRQLARLVGDVLSLSGPVLPNRRWPTAGIFLPRSGFLAVRRWLRPHYLLVALLFSGLLLGACTNTADENAPTALPRASDDERADLDALLNRWEGTLRAEFDWLWERNNHARANGRASSDVCTFTDFNHRPVTIDDEIRTEDKVGTSIHQQLEYAALLIEQSREQWRMFCDQRANSADTVAFMEPRLSQAYNALNIARQTLDTREASRTR